MLKLYITGVYLWIFVKVYKVFSWKTCQHIKLLYINCLCVITYANISDIINVKEQVNCCKKQKHLLQISIRDFYNGLTFLVAQGRIIGTSND